VYAALNSGDLSIVEMRETVLQFAVYSGWPKASRFNIVVDHNVLYVQTEGTVRELTFNFTFNIYAGGDLTIEWSQGGPVMMTGDAVRVFDGEIEI